MKRIVTGLIVLITLILTGCGTGSSASTAAGSGPPAIASRSATTAADVSTIPSNFCSRVDLEKVDKIAGLTYPALTTEISTTDTVSCTAYPPGEAYLAVNLQIGGRCAFAGKPVPSVCQSEADSLYQLAKSNDTLRQIGADDPVSGVGSEADCQTEQVVAGDPSSIESTVNAVFGYVAMSVSAGSCPAAQSITQLVEGELR